MKSAYDPAAHPRCGPRPPDVAECPLDAEHDEAQAVIEGAVQRVAEDLRTLAALRTALAAKAALGA